MDCFFRCCSIYDARVSMFARPISSVSHLPSISLHSISLTTPYFPFAFVRNPPTVLISSKFPWRISCEVIPTKQSHLNPQRQEVRERRLNAMTRFLLQECCFSSSEIPVLMRKAPSIFRRRSIVRAHQVLQMFKDHGFTVEQVKRIIFRNPCVLVFSVDDNLMPKIEYLKALGIGEKDVSFIVSHLPRFLTARLEESLAPKIASLIKFFGSKANLSKALRKAPGIASYEVELVKNKLKILENGGLLGYEIKQILERDPRFLCASEAKIEKNMEFLTRTLGFKPNVVVKYPILLNLSVEKRMRPRYKVVQYVNSLRARNDLSSGLITALLISEADFNEKYLSGSPDVEMLYEKYKGRMADVEVPKLLPTD